MGVGAEREGGGEEADEDGLVEYREKASSVGKGWRQAMAEMGRGEGAGVEAGAVSEGEEAHGCSERGDTPGFERGDTPGEAASFGKGWRQTFAETGGEGGGAVGEREGSRRADGVEGAEAGVRIVVEEGARPASGGGRAGRGSPEVETDEGGGGHRGGGWGDGGADVTAATSERDTVPLHLAARCGDEGPEVETDEGAARVVVDAGAGRGSPEVETDEGGGGHRDDGWGDGGADVGFTTETEPSPLHFTAGCGWGGGGADVAAATPETNLAPLGVAAECGHEVVGMILADVGASGERGVERGGQRGSEPCGERCCGRG
ncbi:hypothetical protein T484DRAFT_1880286, partial [Baffinella frigidus]